MAAKAEDERGIASLCPPDLDKNSPSPFQVWLHRQLENDEEFRKRVEERLNELQLEQQQLDRHPL